MIQFFGKNITTDRWIVSYCLNLHFLPVVQYLILFLGLICVPYVSDYICHPWETFSYIDKMSEVSLPTDIIEPFSTPVSSPPSLPPPTPVSIPHQINKETSVTAGKTRDVITQRDSKDSDSVSVGESDGEVISSWSELWRQIAALSNKLRKHKRTDTLSHTLQTDVFLSTGQGHKYGFCAWSWHPKWINESALRASEWNVATT